MYYVYILCCGDLSLYTGITNNLERRIAAHQCGKGARYTKSHLPVTLVYTEPTADKSAALRRELEIKSLPRCKKLELLFSDTNPLRTAAEALLHGPSCRD